MPPEVSIITVYFNTPEDLLRLRDSASKFLDPAKYEFIVADNHSDRDLSSELPGDVYLCLPQNFGFARASNLAAERARASYLFFVNPDCEFVEDCLSPLLTTMQNSYVAGPKVLNEDGSIQLSFGSYLSVIAEARQKRLMIGERSPSVQEWLESKTATSFHPDYVSGCALMIRANVFQELNGFDENFFLYNEDVDLCKRMTDRGFSVTYDPAAKIVHYRNRSVNKMPGIAKTEYRKSQIYYYKKHHGILQNLFLNLYLKWKGK